MSVSTVPTDIINLGFNPTNQCQSAQFPQISSIWALTLPANVSQQSSHRYIYLGFNLTSQCQSAQFPQIPSIWALSNQPMLVSTVPTDKIYLGLNLKSQCQSAQLSQVPSIWALNLPANVSQHSSHRYHLSGL